MTRARFNAFVLVCLAAVACDETPVVPSAPAAPAPSPAEPLPTIPAMRGLPPTDGPVSELDPVKRVAAEDVCLKQGADTLIDMANTRFAEAVARFGGELAKALPKAELEANWMKIATGHAGFDTIKQGWAETLADTTMAYLPITFTNGQFTAKFACDPQGKITGMWLVRSNKVWKLPRWAKTDSYREIQVTLGDSPWRLPGTLTLPTGDGPFAAMVFVHGTGPLDRDSTIGPTKVFRDLAIGLAQKGIASLRYEKRTRFYAKRFLGGGGAVDLNYETVTDSVAAFAFLGSRKEIDASKLFVLGHDLGGFAVPRIVDAVPGIAGAVIAAGIARPLADADLDQARHVYGLDGLTDDETKLLAEVEKRVAAVKAGPAPDANPAALPMGLPPSYWNDLRGFQPAQKLASWSGPVLVMHAGRDYHSTAADLALWRAGLAKKTNATIKEYADLNHNLMAPEDAATLTPARPGEYVERAWVEPQLVEDVKAFVLANSK